MNNTISSSDTYANDRADSHINMMRKQREKVRFAGGKTYQLSETTKTTTWGNDDETNKQ